MLVSSSDYWEPQTHVKRNGASERSFEQQEDGLSSVASGSHLSEGQQTHTSVFPHTATYESSVYQKSVLGGNFSHPTNQPPAPAGSMFEQMERLNLLAKYNGVNVDHVRIIQEHGEEYVVIQNNYVTLKPKLKLPIAAGKFARWFQVVDPNATIRDDIKMARGVLRKDRFQNPKQLDSYLGVKQQLMDHRGVPTTNAHEDQDKLDKDLQYRIKRVRNKLKHWNAMYKQLHEAIANVDVSNYTTREKVQHVDQICSIYIGRAERALDCFYSEPAAHFMLDMVVSLQKKVADARAINQSYQSILFSAPHQMDTAIV